MTTTVSPIRSFKLGQTVQILGMNTPVGEYLLLGTVTKIIHHVDEEARYLVMIHKTQKELPFFSGQLLTHEESSSCDLMTGGEPDDLGSTAAALMSRDPVIASIPNAMRSAIRRGLMCGPMKNVDFNIEQFVVDWMSDRFMLAHHQAVGDEAKAAIRALWQALTDRKFEA